MSSPTPIPSTSPPTAATPPAEGGVNLSALLTDLTNPDLTLTDIAQSRNLSLDELTLLITRPDIAEKLAALHTLAVSRTRLIASALLPRCITALNSIIEHNQSATELDTVLPPHKRRSPELTHRANESTRRAATRIIQISNFNPPRLFAPLPPPKVARLSVARLSEPGAQTIQTQVTQARVTQTRVPQARVAQASRLCASEPPDSPVAHASRLCDIDQQAPTTAQPPAHRSRPNTSPHHPDQPPRPHPILPLSTAVIPPQSPPLSPAALLNSVGSSPSLSFLAPIREHWP